MTLKAVMGLRWLAEFCPEAPYAIKADDDTFLNIFEIVPKMTDNIDKPNVSISRALSLRIARILVYIQRVARISITIIAHEYITAQSSIIQTRRQLQGVKAP